jgi:membrane fusion protein
VYLFRRKVLQAQRAQHLGTIRLGGPPSFSVVTGVALALALALVSFAMWGHITRKARLPGMLVPTLGSLQLPAPQAGIVLETSVREGDLVRAGHPLVVLGVDRTTAQGSTAALVAGTLAQRRSTLLAERALRELHSSQRREALLERIRHAESEQRRARGEAELAHRRVHLAGKTLDRYRQLAAEGFVADVQAQQKQEELLDLQARAQTAERSAAAAAAQLHALQAEHAIHATQLRTELAQLDRTLASLEQEGAENESRRRVVITAPHDGMVTARTFSVGQGVQAGHTLLTLIPQTLQDAANGQPAELRAQLYAPSRTAGFIEPGQTVWLRYAAYPYQKFGMAPGEIEAVSRTPINPQDLPAGQAQALLAAAQVNEPLYRIDVRIQHQHIVAYGERQWLKPGMALEADVIQDRRAVWEWVMEPVLAVSANARASHANGISPGIVR